MEAYPILSDVRKSQAGKDRSVIKIAITDEAKLVVTRLAERYGMKEYVVASAVYRWFIEQDDIYQRAVLGLLHGLEVDAAKAFMERLKEGATAPWGAKVPGPSPSPSPNSAADLSGIHTNLDKISRPRAKRNAGPS